MFVLALNVFSAASTFVLNNEEEEVPVKVPNYRVELGFGLHVGWAVEGAIGSEFKIDATYLSPNVHLCSRLRLRWRVPLVNHPTWLTAVQKMAAEICYLSTKFLEICSKI